MKWFKDFRFSRVEKRGLAVLLLLIFFVILVRVAIIFLPSKELPSNLNLKEEIATWEANFREEMRVPHRFDPNTVSEEFVRKTQLTSFVQNNWLKFRANNRFNDPEDVLKLYGMDSTWFDVNKDSIRIIQKPEAETVVEVTYFYFDPNKISENQWQQLGTPEWLAARIVKYRNSGGQFMQPQDLMKIYDFPKELFVKLEPWIRIEAPKSIPKVDELREPENTQLVDLNTADSLGLIQVNGVGPTFAHRILVFREQLGGFVEIGQLKEVYGISPERFEEMKPQFTVDESLVRTINVNQATFKELLRHPYLNYDQVKSIVYYREKMKPHESIDDLVNFSSFTSEEVEKVKPYLRVK